MSSLTPFQLQQLAASGRVSPSLLAQYGQQAGTLQAPGELMMSPPEPALTPGQLQAPSGIITAPAMSPPGPLSPGMLTPPEAPSTTAPDKGLDPSRILSMLKAMQSGSNMMKTPQRNYINPGTTQSISLRGGIGLGKYGL